MRDIGKRLDEFLSDDVNQASCWLLSLSAVLLYSCCYGHVVEYNGSGYPLLPDHILWKAVGWLFMIAVCGRVFGLSSAKTCKKALWMIFIVCALFLVWMGSDRAAYVYMHLYVSAEDASYIEFLSAFTERMPQHQVDMLTQWWKELRDHVRPGVEVNLWGTILTCALLVMVPSMHVYRESLIDDREALPPEDGSDS